MIGKGNGESFVIAPREILGNQINDVVAFGQLEVGDKVFIFAIGRGVEAHVRTLNVYGEAVSDTIGVLIEQLGFADFLAVYLQCGGVDFIGFYMDSTCVFGINLCRVNSQELAVDEQCREDVLYHGHGPEFGAEGIVHECGGTADGVCVVKTKGGGYAGERETSTVLPALTTGCGYIELSIGITMCTALAHDDGCNGFVSTEFDSGAFGEAAQLNVTQGVIVSRDQINGVIGFGGCKVLDEVFFLRFGLGVECYIGQNDILFYDPVCFKGKLKEECQI